MESTYVGVEPSPFQEKAFDPQSEPLGISETTQSEDSIITLSNGSKPEFVKNGVNKQAYLIQKNGTHALADGNFPLPNGKQLTISKGIIVQSI